MEGRPNEQKTDNEAADKGMGTAGAQRPSAANFADTREGMVGIRRQTGGNWIQCGMYGAVQNYCRWRWGEKKRQGGLVRLDWPVCRGGTNFTSGGTGGRRDTHNPRHWIQVNIEQSQKQCPRVYPRISNMTCNE